MNNSPTHDVESSNFDKCLGIYVEISGDDGKSKVLARGRDHKRNHDGKRIGVTNLNPILNIVIYNVEVPDGNIREYTANIISENMWNQVNDDGYNFNILYEIIGHRKNNDAISKDDEFYKT